jgi:hypothetical protein
MTPATRDRLEKLVRMLSSDKDGEVLAATAAIRRVLATEGLDIHSLADALCRPAPRAEQRAPHKDRAEDTDWYSMACECDAHEDRLSEREQKFISDMVTWTARRAPTEKQQAWLLAIFARVRRHG